MVLSIILMDTQRHLILKIIPMMLIRQKKRAEGDASEVWGAMCKQDTRLVQTVTMSDVFGNVFIRHSMGNFSENTQTEETEA
jgi:hypothetical protein